MEIYLNEYILALLSIISGAAGYFMIYLNNKVDNLETALAEHKEKDALIFLTKKEGERLEENYKDFLEALIEPIHRKLESIEIHMRTKQ